MEGEKKHVLLSSSFITLMFSLAFFNTVSYIYLTKCLLQFFHIKCGSHKTRWNLLTSFSHIQFKVCVHLKLKNLNLVAMCKYKVKQWHPTNAVLSHISSRFLIAFFFKKSIHPKHCEMPLRCKGLVRVKDFKKELETQY